MLTVLADAGAVASITRMLLDLVQNWLDQPAWDPLLNLFVMRRPRPQERVACSANQNLTEQWLAGEVVPAHAVRASAEPRACALLHKLLLLEEAADFCWNLRQGHPRALLHAIRTVLAGSKADPLAAAAPDLLPRLAKPEWSRAKTAQRVVEVYLGPDAQLDRRPQNAQMLDEVALYPARPRETYQERWQASAMHPSERDGRVIGAAADDLGLITPSLPAHDWYSQAIVLGGGGLTPLRRVVHLDRLLNECQPAIDAIWLLGSGRHIGAEERSATDQFAPAARDEFDLMCAAAQQALGARGGSTTLVCGCADAEQPCGQWQAQMLEAGCERDAVELTPVAFQHSRLRTYAVSRFGPVHVLSAPTSNPPSRPNTADTYRTLVSLAHIERASRLLVVTSQLFVPFQTFDALRMLTAPTGASVEVLGLPNTEDRGEAPGLLLQEVLSAVRSARRLLVATTIEVDLDLC